MICACCKPSWSVGSTSRLTLEGETLELEAGVEFDTETDAEALAATLLSGRQGEAWTLRLSLGFARLWLVESVAGSPADE